MSRDRTASSSAPVTRLGLVASGTALALGVAGCGLVGGGPGQKTLTAEFVRTVGLYEQSDVRVLGVAIGKVTDIEPIGTKVKVTMTYDDKYKIPADAKAVVVAPSIVSDRYVQLIPVYVGGTVISDEAELGIDDTEVPLELDEVFASLDELNVALGPKGANKDGALNDLLQVSAENLDGNGQLLNDTLVQFSGLVGTLNNNRDNLFATIRNLQDFTTTIANRDTTVRDFNRDLASVADQLEGEREDLATAIKQLSVALGEVASFVRDNKVSLTANISDLASVTKVIVNQKKALEEFVETAPGALSNLQLAYNPSSGTLDTRDNGAGMAEANPLGAVCNLLITIGVGGEECAALDDQLPDIPGDGGPPELPGGVPLPPLPGGAPALKSGAAPAAAPADNPAAGRTAVRTEPVARDMTLGGILDGGR